jgi:hypothetical protein
MHVRKMLYCDLIYPLLAYGIVVWGQIVKALSRQIFILQKLAVRYKSGLKQLDSFRDSLRQLKMLARYPLNFQETILYAKENFNCKYIQHKK